MTRMRAIRLRYSFMMCCSIFASLGILVILSFNFLGCPGRSSGTPSCATTCDGCCNQNNICIGLDEQEDTVCGNSGYTCKKCSSDKTCDITQGKCVTVSSTTECNATSCPNGCCAGNPAQCVQPQTNQQCGLNGTVCIDCTQGGTINQTCNTITGTCQSSDLCINKCQGEYDGVSATCPSNTCQGCCTNTSPPQCLAGTDSLNCGIEGSICQDCTQNNQTCSSGGTCITTTTGNCQVSLSVHEVNCCSGINTIDDCLEDRCVNGELILYHCASDGSCVSTKQACSNWTCEYPTYGHSHYCAQ